MSHIHTLRYRPVGSFSTVSSSKSGGSLVLNTLSEVGGNANTEPEFILVAKLQPYKANSTRDFFNLAIIYLLIIYIFLFFIVRGSASDWNGER